MWFGLNRFTWKPSPEEFTASLVVPTPFRAKLNRLPKGVDNVHIDVLLSQKLMDAFRQLVRPMMEYEINERLSLGWKWIVSPTHENIEIFQEAYKSVMEASFSTARMTAQREIVQLAQLSVLKFLFMLVDQEILSFREELQRQRGHGSHRGRAAAHIQECLTAFSREKSQVRQLVAQKTVIYIQRMEITSLRKLRKSLLDQSWPIPPEILFNPLLTFSSLWNEEAVVHHYPLIGTGHGRLNEFSKVNYIITGLFSDYLPDWALSLERDFSDATSSLGPSGFSRLRTDQGDLAGFLEVELLLSRSLQEEEYRYGKVSWLDEPANLDRILRPESLGSNSSTTEETMLPFYRNNKKSIEFPKYLIKKAEEQFESSNLLKKILAIQETPAVFEKLRHEIPVNLIVEYLEGKLSKKQMVIAVENIKDVEGLDTNAVLNCLEAAKSAGRSLMKPDRRRQCIADFIINFLRLRRDLKLAYQAYRVMDQIRLLREEETIALSRRNSSLHEFLVPEEQVNEQGQIRGHAILKADLRGSSRITKELRARCLNPATHFSLNFFGPINSLLERFGAKKVFVEGDAVILSFYEYEGDSRGWLALCLASGLARKILEVVDAQNAQNRKHDLPELELGMGIAWVAEAPAFLYDDGHEIVISPAINRADRLSSCAASLRKTELGGRLPRGVEVVVPVNQGIMQKDSGDNLLRYNVNGIELDPVAFPKLKQELALRKVASVTFPEYSPNSVFYIGSYPDKTGFLQLLVVREATVRQWIGNEVSSSEDTQGRVFYEIITSPHVIERLQAALTTSARAERLIEIILEPEV